MICLDTHILVWLAIAPHKLSSKAINAIHGTSEFLISDISIWEISILEHKKRLILPLPFESFFELLLGSRNFIVSPITPSIAAISNTILMHKDPADRLICATAIAHNVVLITKDKEIIRSRVVETVW